MHKWPTSQDSCVLHTIKALHTKNLCTRNANGSSSEAIYGLCKLNRNNGIMHTEATKTPDFTILWVSSSVNNFSYPSWSGRLLANRSRNWGPLVIFAVKQSVHNTTIGNRFYTSAVSWDGRIYRGPTSEIALSRHFKGHIDLKLLHFMWDDRKSCQCFNTRFRF